MLLYDTLSIYDTTIVFLIINWSDTTAFCMHEMHNSTTYDIETSLQVFDLLAAMQSEHTQHPAN
jgi:hypothetical protein